MDSGVRCGCDSYCPLGSAHGRKTNRRPVTMTSANRESSRVLVNVATRLLALRRARVRPFGYDAITKWSNDSNLFWNLHHPLEALGRLAFVRRYSATSERGLPTSRYGFGHSQRRV